MVRVFIDRRVMEDKIPQYKLAVRSIRLAAMECDGYISGETLQDVSDPCRYVVLSTWNSLGAWKAWAGSQSRREMMTKLAPMLTEREQVTVLEPV